MTAKHMLQCLAIMAVSMPAAGNANPNSESYTKEQMLLFGTHHLNNITFKSVLHYDFHQSGTHAREIKDKVALTITRVSEDNAKDLKVEFLSGVDKRPFAGIKNFYSNPVIMHFLQWDSEKMSGGRRVTHHHFRHLLRQAFRNDMRSEEVTVIYNGRKLKGTRLFFRPLANKADNKKYEGYPGKLYEFILIESIPGYVYSISTLITGKNPRAEPLESARMTFNRIESKKSE